MHMNNKNSDITEYPPKILNRYPKKSISDPQYGNGVEYSSNSDSQQSYGNYVFQIGIAAKMGKNLGDMSDTIFSNVRNSTGWNEYLTE